MLLARHMLHNATNQLLGRNETEPNETELLVLIWSAERVASRRHLYSASASANVKYFVLYAVVLVACDEG